MSTKDLRKRISKDEKRIKKAKRELRGLRLSRVGLWLTPIIGWLGLPINGRKQDALKTQIAANEHIILLAEQTLMQQLGGSND